MIPVAQWADESTWNFCFENIPHNYVLVVSTVETRRLDNRKLFVDGFDSMINTLAPRILLVYGEFKPFCFEGYVNEVHYYPSE